MFILEQIDVARGCSSAPHLPNWKFSAYVINKEYMLQKTKPNKNRYPL
jgi:hypothetical protein